jgi:uncharacterized protein YdhG (YjbR/CyaY superfamily)
MKERPSKREAMDTYISQFPAEVAAILRKVRSTIRRSAPGANETISYGIPTFTLNGRYLVYFAGYKNHISLYPVPKGTPALNKALAGNRKGSGTLQFALNEPVPYGLISKVVKALAKDNAARAKAQGKR